LHHTPPVISAAGLERLRAKYGLAEESDGESDGYEDYVGMAFDDEEWYSSEGEVEDDAVAQAPPVRSTKTTLADIVENDSEPMEDERDHRDESDSATSSDEAYSPTEELAASSAQPQRRRERPRARARGVQRPQPHASAFVASAATAAESEEHASAAAFTGAPETAAAAAVSPRLTTRGRNVRREWRLDPRQVDVFSDDFKALPLEIQVHGRNHSCGVVLTKEYPRTSTTQTHPPFPLPVRDCH
jgi:hypothetical protein